MPKRMLVIGGGIIGLEMATVYSTLGARIDVVEMLDGLMQGADRDMVKVWQKFNEKRFDKIMLKTKTVAVEALKEGIKVSFRSAEAGRDGAGTASSTTWCWWQSGAARTARRSPPTRLALRSLIAASSTSIRRCAPTCRTSSPSATSSASRCWRTRRCMKRTWQQKPRQARSPTSTRA